MYRRIFRVLRASRGKKLVVLVVVANYLPFTTLLCLCHHMGYHVVTPAHQSPSRRWTAEAHGGHADDGNWRRRDEDGGTFGMIPASEASATAPAALSAARPGETPALPWWRPRAGTEGRTGFPVPPGTKSASDAVIFSKGPQDVVEPPVGLLAGGRSGSLAKTIALQTGRGERVDHPAEVSLSPPGRYDRRGNSVVPATGQSERLADRVTPQNDGPAATKESLPATATITQEERLGGNSWDAGVDRFLAASNPTATPMLGLSARHGRTREVQPAWTSRPAPQLERTNPHATGRAFLNHQTTSREPAILQQTPPQQPSPDRQTGSQTPANHGEGLQTPRSYQGASETPPNRRAAWPTWTNHRETSQTAANLQTASQTTTAVPQPASRASTNHRPARQRSASHQAADVTPDIPRRGSGGKKDERDFPESRGEGGKTAAIPAAGKSRSGPPEIPEASSWFERPVRFYSEARLADAWTYRFQPGSSDDSGGASGVGVLVGDSEGGRNGNARGISGASSSLASGSDDTPAGPRLVPSGKYEPPSHGVRVSLLTEDATAPRNRSREDDDSARLLALPSPSSSSSETAVMTMDNDDEEFDNDAGGHGGDDVAGDAPSHGNPALTSGVSAEDRDPASRRKRDLPELPPPAATSGSGPDLLDPGPDLNFDLDPDLTLDPVAAHAAGSPGTTERGEPGRRGGDSVSSLSYAPSAAASTLSTVAENNSSNDGKGNDKGNDDGETSNAIINNDITSASSTSDDNVTTSTYSNGNRVQPPQTKRSTQVTSKTPQTTITTTLTKANRDKDPDGDSNAEGDNNEVVKIGVILPFAGKLPFVLHKTHPALVLAVERVTREGLLGERNVSLVLRDSLCSETYGPLQGIDLYVQKAAHVFLGPACDYAVAPLARFTFRWQIPILTAGALVSAFQDRGEYRLLTRVQGAYAKAGEFVQSVFSNFKWKWAGMLFHDTRDSPNQGRSNCYFMIEAIFLTLRNAYGAEPWHALFNADRDVDYEDHLRDMSHAARVVVLCSSPDSVREIMIKAHDLNFDNGEYVFFNIDLFSSKNDSQKPWYRKADTDERNAKARKAYEALMTVTLRKPTSPEYRQFSNDVKERARTMYPNFTYGEEEVNSFVGAFHDAVLLYALALNETLENHGSISDGAAITKRMWNRTFEGITGNVSIDDNGDRNADYSLLDLNPATGEFEVVANYYGNKKKYEPVPGKSIHWAGGRTEAPPDTPLCGFDGSKCPPEEPFPEYGIVIIVLGSILLIVIIAVFVIYRHIKLEAELAEMNWRVRWEDILFGSLEKNRKLEREGSKLSLVKKGSCPSSASGDTLAFQLSDAGNRQLFTKTGFYKGAIIAIKSILRTNITISKPLLLEIKRMKDLQNDHIVRFIGACIDYPNQCMLTEYCPKGSLQDVLENDQIKLDWMFRYSIMQDIVRGMAYLHGTDLRSHGNLKSTNCVVDSRFVVKIADFGLHYFRHNPEGVEEENSYSNFHSKLWTAPELLRMQCRPAEGTPKGDVYSFAIICQEIVYRNGVFYLANLDLTPHEIYGKVRNGLRPYFRPTLEEFDCPCDELAHVIGRCWAEDPSDRPDFTQLKTIIRKLNREGDKGNILDNLLSRMEQYANNLEALVEERTADYLQQKKKAEDLLYNMLPRSVALQLIRGESVTAESFDSVSIYFSDICGFTAMSAESTPMQVVDLLNDLYTTFDSIIENFDVYKVETIGDAYMVVSGLPEKNGNLHAREIARMSLMLLEAVLSFRIRHRPTEQLKLRIGIHSGPVCTGVVGHKMPRYCLFGDTVNTASRMESNGLPLRIHMSNASKLVLDRFGTFILESRGEVSMKGKGTMVTWWLLGERPIQDSPGGGAALNIL